MKIKGEFLVAILTAVLCISGNVLAYSGSGDGSAGNPYQIANVPDWEELMWASADWNQHFILTADLDLDLAEGGIFPVGNSSIPFTGVFNGNSHTISNLTITESTQDYIGLFGYVSSGGQILNLGVEDVNITGRSYVGGLVGRNDGGTLTGCYATGSVTGASDYVGGLVGENLGSGSLTACYATGSVTGINQVGGLVGRNDGGGTLTSCYATGSVSGTNNVGGLVGRIFSGTLTGCYATGSVTGTGNVGGLVGKKDSGTVTNCFWDTETCLPVTVGVGTGTSEGVTGKTTIQMKTLSTFTDAGWDFINMWFMPDDSYPHLGCEHYEGSGTQVNPYQIYSPQQMNAIGANPADWGKYFKLMADVNMSAYTGTQYNIIGNPTTQFTGVFDGDGHTISNLTITASTQDFIGLFGYVGSGGQIRNLGVEDVNITGRYYVGGLVGENDGSLTGCYATGSVTGTGDCVGGLVGRINNGTLTGCYATGSVTGGWYVGGLVGYAYSGTLTACYATGSVNGTDLVGGLVGDNYYGSITSCYATGSVTGYFWVGGLVGYNEHSISNCYSTSAVSGTHNVGGLVGSNYGTLTSCFWDTQTSGKSVGVGYGTSTGVTGKTTAEMKTLSTFTEASWDFASVWAMPLGQYPVLFPRQMGDLNSDTRVDIQDFAIFADNWLEGI